MPFSARRTQRGFASQLTLPFRLSASGVLCSTTASQQRNPANWGLPICDNTLHRFMLRPMSSLPWSGSLPSGCGPPSSLPLGPTE